MVRWCWLVFGLKSDQISNSIRIGLGNDQVVLITALRLLECTQSAINIYRTRRDQRRGKS